MLDSADLVGIEIGQSSIKATVLSSDASSIMRHAEAELPDAKGGSLHIDDTVERLWRELGLDLSADVRVAVAVSHKHAGVGSGPAIESWIDNLGKDLGRKVQRVGEQFKGISYVPADLLEQVSAAFKPLNVELDRIELAPISAARCFEPKATCSFTVESGVSWLARVHSGLILEALVSEEACESSGVAITRGTNTGPISDIYGLAASEELLASLRVSLHDVAVPVGAARGLVDRTAGNLMKGSTASDGPAAKSTHTTSGETTEVLPRSDLTQPLEELVSKPEDRAQFRPLPPQHATTTTQAARSNGTTSLRPKPLEPSEHRVGFEPSEKHSQVPTPAFLPPTESTTKPKVDVEPTAEPKNTSLPSGSRQRKRTPRKRSHRSSTIDARRPKIDPTHQSSEFTAEPFLDQPQANSKFNFKLLTVGLAVFIVVGLLLLLLGPV